MDCQYQIKLKYVKNFWRWSMEGCDLTSLYQLHALCGKYTWKELVISFVQTIKSPTVLLNLGDMSFCFITSCLNCFCTECGILQNSVKVAVFSDPILCCFVPVLISVQNYIQEDSNFHSHCCTNFRFYDKVKLRLLLSGM